jgi:hypothetical protein
MLTFILGEPQAVRLKAATREWLAHTVMCCVLLAGIYAVEQFLYFLWGRGTDPMLFGWFPFRYVFHAADFAVIAIFLVYGVWKTIWIYIRGPE